LDELPSLARRVDMLAGNLTRAKKYGTGLILFAVYQAEATRAEVEQKLRTRLAEQDQPVRRVQFFAGDHDTARSDLMERLRANFPADNDVVFIYDLHYAFPGLLNSLNYKREYVPENKWRLLFWTREDEVITVMRDAPDFWAFVNQTVELPEIPPLAEHAKQAERLTWGGLEWADEFRRLTPDERRARIALRERLLADLPDDETTVATRAELHYVIGALYSFERELAETEKHFRMALNLAQEGGNRRQVASCLNGLGNVYRNLGRLDEALESFQKAVELELSYKASIRGSLAGALKKLGRDNIWSRHWRKPPVCETGPNGTRIWSRCASTLASRRWWRNE